MTSTKQRLALSIIDFLSTSLKDGTLSSEDSESIEVAQNCISDCFKVDASAPQFTAKDTQSLLQIYSVYEKLKGASAADSNAKTSSGSISEAQKKEADGLKSKGNAAMASKNHKEAIELYSQALAIVPGNPIFLSNRAAAYSADKDHESAMADAEAATVADPKYTKAWSRLGLARFALGDARGAMEAYERGIQEEGNGGSEAMRKGFETARKRTEELEAEGGNADEDDVARGAGSSGGGTGGMPDLASLAGMFGGGGGGGGSGMPDLSKIMNNPMLAGMAQKVMSNPDMLNSIMNNPKLKEMASQFGGGGGAGEGAGRGGGGRGMPDLSALMQDPSIAEMAKNMLGGGGAGAGRGQGQ